MALLDPLLAPLLKYDPKILVIGVSLLFALISAFATKYMTNQKLMKSHKEEMKKIQKQAKELSKTNPEKALSLQQKMMELNTVIMKESFKPMIITIIPFILIFGWLNANLTYIPIDAGVPFDVSAEISGVGNATLEVLPSEGVEFISNSTVPINDELAVWKLKANNGSYTLKFHYDDVSEVHDLIIGDSYAKPEERHNSEIKKTIIGNEKLKFKFFGFEVSWFITYMLSSIILNILIRKALKIV